MAELKLYVDAGRLYFIENEDRNGPTMSIALADKQALRQAINRMSVDGDEEIETGEFGRNEQSNTTVVAVYQNEADADAFVAGNSGVTKVRELSADGFDFKIVTI